MLRHAYYTLFQNIYTYYTFQDSEPAAGAQRESYFCLLYFMDLPNHSFASENSVHCLARQRPQSDHFAPKRSVLFLVQRRASGALPMIR